MFGDEIEWLREQIHAVAATYVVFETIDGTRVPLIATKGATDYQFDAGDGYASQTHVIDFLVNPADLPARPKSGDRIDELDGEGGQVIASYVVAPEPGTNAWSWSGQARKMMRIHTKQMGND